MQSFDLTLANARGEVIFHLIPATQPYGSFTKGDKLNWAGHDYEMMAVDHRFLPQPGGGILCQTLLTLG